MSPTEFNTEVAKTVRSLRADKRPVFKQQEMADALNMTQSNYSRLEKGEYIITKEQLAIIGEKLGLKPFRILILALIQMNNSCEREELTEYFVSALLLCNDWKKPITHSGEELTFATDLLKDHYSKRNQR